MRTRQRERGTAVVELAISVPLLVFLIMLVGEGAAVIRTHQLVNNAAREGARFSILPPNSCSGNATCLAQIRQVVVNYGSNNGITISPANVNIDQTALVATSGAAISSSLITVTYTYQLQYLPAFAGIPPTMSLGARAQFRNFYGN